MTTMFSTIRTRLYTAAKNPFRTYFKIGSAGFGATFASNMVWSAIDQDAPLSISSNPEMYSACLFAKSAYSGFLWPAIPFRIYNSPRRFFCVGASFQERLYNTFNGDLLLSTEQDLEYLIKQVDEIGSTARKYVRKGLENGTITVTINGQDGKEMFLKRLS